MKSKLQKSIASKNILLFSIFLVLICIAIFPLIRPGFFVTDDGEWMIIRFSAFYQELAQGYIPVRVLGRLNNSYGYPVSTFLYPAFMYLASFFKLIGFGVTSSVKIVLIASLAASFLFSYLWLSKSFNKTASFFGSVLYLFHPYFLWDVYRRGSVGEVLALAVTPMCLWAISSGRLVILSLSYGLLILSHNTVALLLIPMLFLYHVISQKVSASAVKRTINAGIPLLTGALLSAFFSAPALYELRYTVFNTITISSVSEYFVSFDKFYLFGLLHVVLVALGLMLVYKRKKLVKETLFMLLVFSIALVFSTGVSSAVWSLLPLGQLVQFPFRFLSLLVVSGSFLGAYTIHFGITRQRYVQIIYALSFLFVVSTSYAWTRPTEYFDKGDAYYETNEATTTVKDEYMPVWVKVKPDARAEKRVERLDKDTVQINKVYWPGYEVFAHGEKLPINYSNKNGLIQVSYKGDLNDIEVSFKETPLRMLSDLVSFITLGALGVFVIRQYIVKKRG